MTNGESAPPRDQGAAAPQVGVRKADADYRPLPFTLLVAVQWRPVEAPSNSTVDERLFFARRAGLTGDFTTTSDGQDMSLSDLEVG